MTAGQQWVQKVADLLVGLHSATGDPVDAGARLVVLDPDGEEVYRAALARHLRIDDTKQTLWIRPLHGGQDTVDRYLFNLNVARRRALHWESIRLLERTVEIDLATGQRARIEPADGHELKELHRWDAFTDRLTSQEETELRLLDADSWHGRYA